MYFLLVDSRCRRCTYVHIACMALVCPITRTSLEMRLAEGSKTPLGASRSLSLSPSSSARGCEGRAEERRNAVRKVLASRTLSNGARIIRIVLAVLSRFSFGSGPSCSLSRHEVSSKLGKTRARPMIVRAFGPTYIIVNRNYVSLL